MLSPSVQITIVNAMGTTKEKENFTKCQIDVLVSEVEAGQTIVFDSLSSGISNEKIHSGREW